MTKRTRLFLLVSAAVLLLGLGTGVIASYFGLQGLSGLVSSEPDELAYVADNAAVVAFANVRSVMDSDLRRRVQAMRPDTRGRAPADFQARTGINIETDIDRVIVSLTAGGDDRQPLVLARGRFDQVRIETSLRGRGGQIEDYRGTPLITAAGREETFAVAFLEPGLVGLGTPASIRRAIDTYTGSNTGVAGNSELMRLIREVDAGDAWAVGRVDAMTRARLPQDFASRLPPITWFAATGRVNGGLQGMVRVEVSTDESARDLREVIRGFLALVRLQTRQSAELAVLLESLQLGGEGRDVSLRFSIPPEAVDALARIRPPARPDSTP